MAGEFHDGGAGGGGWSALRLSAPTLVPSGKAPCAPWAAPRSQAVLLTAVLLKQKALPYARPRPTRRVNPHNTRILEVSQAQWFKGFINACDSLSEL